MEERGIRKMRVGRVVSDKMEKTLVVAIEELTAHPVYGKRIRRTKKLKVHDEESQAHMGDLVRVMETRPLSREKRWRLLEILERGKV